MFKIPAWEDDGPKAVSTFLQKAKKKEKTDKKPKSKDNHVTRIKEKNNNVSVNDLSHASRKRKIENIVSIKTKQDTKKNKSEETVTIPEAQNFDEILLNAKKKKFNEVIEKDDQEDLLFSENKQEKRKKKKAKVSPNSLNTNGKSTEELTKQNNKKQNRKHDKDNKTNSEVNAVTEPMDSKKAKLKSLLDRTSHRTPSNVSKTGKKQKNSRVEEDDNESNSEVNEVTEPIDNKKFRLKSLLDTKSHRTPINVSKTGNKLRDRMLERLKAAQFRYLNEKLYTSSGSEAQQLFQSDPAAFETYHQGYQLQVKKWPVNPLDVIVKKIMKMPKTHMIADLGCGEAALSRRVPHKVRSFDLVATAPGVEACDMARTPLLTASMDVTVYCLALMGTELTQYLVEANRVLKMGGHLLIAEVESRFDKVEDFAKEVERLGFKLKQLDKSNNVFFFMEFTKIRDPPVKKAKLPALTLKPCLYKRR